MVKMMEYRTRNGKEKEEGKLKSMPTADISTAAVASAALVADYGVGPRRRSSYAAKQLKDANRLLNRMKGQKQGT